MIPYFKYLKISTANGNSFGLTNVFGDAYIMKLPSAGWMFKEVNLNQQIFTLFLQDPTHQLEKDINFIDEKADKSKTH